MKITREFTFDAAHKLHNYKGDCKRLHGHTYRLHVTLNGKVDEDGFIMDFKKIKEIVKDNVLDILDHNYINDIIEQPTAENMCFWIWSKLKPGFKEMLYEIKLWETPNCFVSYNGDEK